MSILIRARLLRPALALAAGAAALVLSSGIAAAQKPYGFATLPPARSTTRTASAIAKVLKEKGGMNVLVQPTAGDQVIIPMVKRGEADIGIANILGSAMRRTAKGNNRTCG